METKSTMQISSQDDSYFSKFSTGDDCEGILQERPWLLNGRLIVMKKWSSDTPLESDLLSTMPIWLSSQTCITNSVNDYSQQDGKMTSYIGKPLLLDRATALGERLANSFSWKACLCYVFY